MARWGDAWGTSWTDTPAESEEQAAPWGSAWGVPWTSTPAQAESEASGGVYSGFVQPKPGKPRKKLKRLNDDLNKLVDEALGGESQSDANKVTAPQEPPLKDIEAKTQTTQIAKTILPLIPLDSDDDEALILLLAA